MMKISSETYDQLNKLLQKSFDCNAIADNFAYNIDYMRYPNIGDIYHHSFAHAFPAFADRISPIMIELNARPIRIGLADHTEEYRSLYDVFLNNDLMVEDYRDTIKKTIEVAELNDDYEVKIAMENFLNDFLPYVKQADIWRNKAQQYSEDPDNFDVHFKDFTTFIEVVE